MTTKRKVRKLVDTDALPDDQVVEEQKSRKSGSGRNGYTLFLTSKMSNVTGVDKKIRFKEVGDMWKAASREERAHYQQLALQAREDDAWDQAVERVKAPGFGQAIESTPDLSYSSPCRWPEASVFGLSPSIDTFLMNLGELH